MNNHPLCIARTAKGLTMRALALKMDMGEYGHRRIYGWEHGETLPTLLYAKALAEALGFASGQIVRDVCQQWRQQQNISSCSEARPVKAETYNG